MVLPVELMLLTVPVNAWIISWAPDEAGTDNRHPAAIKVLTNAFSISALPICLDLLAGATRNASPAGTASIVIGELNRKATYSYLPFAGKSPFRRKPGRPSRYREAASGARSSTICC